MWYLRYKQYQANGGVSDLKESRLGGHQQGKSDMCSGPLDGVYSCSRQCWNGCCLQPEQVGTNDVNGNRREQFGWEVKEELQESRQSGPEYTAQV